MNRASRVLAVLVVTLLGALTSAGIARAADVTNANGTNVQSGNNRSTTNQGGTSKSGDAVGGQVTGVVSAGRTSVDARNTSSNSDVTSGDARGTNTANSFTGLNAADTTTVGGTADVTNSCELAFCANVQDGNNTSNLTQSANYTTGDGVAGEVIGAVTAGGGSASIVAANTSSNDDVTTGDARGTNDAAAFTGLNSADSNTSVAAGADVTNTCLASECFNVQDGNNRANVRQTSTASTGDGVAGQVIGAVSAGATSIDANNRSDNVDVTTGDANTDNTDSAFTGENTDFNGSLALGPGATDITNSCDLSICINVQDGDNRTSVSQNAKSSTGDGVGGEVIGAVTSAGGSASIVAANTSTNSDITTGDAQSTNDLASFVGLNGTDATTTVAADITATCSPAICGNVQDGSNSFNGNQTATSSTGDGVAGQVLGVVSAGAASLDATNRTDDSDVTTGDSRSDNSASEFVGLNVAATTTVGSGPLASDVASVTADNVQDGSNRRSLNQTADAASGDGVAGQVSGVVTSAGGSASVVLANTSTGIDSTSGDSRFDNTDSGFVGLNFSFVGPVTVF
jgi:hypothetical protein